MTDQKALYYLLAEVSVYFSSKQSNRDSKSLKIYFRYFLVQLYVCENITTSLDRLDFKTCSANGVEPPIFLLMLGEILTEGATPALHTLQSKLANTHSLSLFL